MSTPRLPLRLLAALFAFALLGAACGDDDSADDPTVEDEGDTGATDEGSEDEGDGGGDEGSGDIPDPCTFLTLAELETLFGSPFDEGELTDNTDSIGGKQCTWGGVDGMTAKVVSIAVTTDAAVEEVFPISGEEVFEQTRTAVADSITEPDLGLGDDSYRTGSSIYVRDGDTNYTFMITGTSEEAVDGLKQMATQVVEAQG
jgi:hypothetical protein